MVDKMVKPCYNTYMNTKEQKMIAEQQNQWVGHYDERHGGPYDRGAADSWYQRGFNPHYYVGDTYSTPRVELAQMTAAEITAYTAGYRYNESSGNFKDWG
jgi:hypothetical protein